MERSEPTLVPQWLKNTGTQNGGSSITHSGISADHNPLKLARNKSSADNNSDNFERSFSFDSTTLPFFRRSSSINGSGHSKSRGSFGRNKHHRVWEKGTYVSHKDKTFLGDQDRWHRSLSDSLENTSLNKYDRDGLRYSHSKVFGKLGDTSCKEVIPDLATYGNVANGSLSKGSSVGGVNKITFERDFPSLGADERAVTSEVGRVPSPGLTSSIQRLTLGASTIISSEKWTSALAEVPISVASNGTGMLAVQHDGASSSSSPLPGGIATSRNMAEALAQGPGRSQTTLQLSAGTQRVEELASKQSRQLIPVMPSAPRTSALNSSDRQKPKGGQQQHLISSSFAFNHSPRGGAGRGDVSRALNVGKLHVLKPGREKNGAAPVAKDTLSLATGGKPVSTKLAAPSVSGSGAARGPPSNPGHERKSVWEKRPTSQARSRNDFFNSVRRKSIADSSSIADSTTGSSTSVADSTTGSSSSVADSTTGSSSIADSSAGSLPSVIEIDTVASPTSSDKLGEVEFVHDPDTSQDGDGSYIVSPIGNHLSEMRGDSACNGSDACIQQKNFSNQNKFFSSDPIFTEEEEAAFLRSLGWEENADEGGLTEEEINAFFRDVVTKGVHLELLSPVNSHIRSSMSGISAGVGSYDAKLES